LHLTDKSVENSSYSRKKISKHKKSISSDSEEIVWSLVPFDCLVDDSNGASRIEDKASPTEQDIIPSPEIVIVSHGSMGLGSGSNYNRLSNSHLEEEEKVQRAGDDQWNESDDESLEKSIMKSVSLLDQGRNSSGQIGMPLIAPNFREPEIEPSDAPCPLIQQPAPVTRDQSKRRFPMRSKASSSEAKITLLR
jgi:hypothetical protein